MGILRSNLLTEINELGLFELREDDAKECEKLGLTSMEAVRLSIESSERSYAITLDEKILAVWGWKSRDDYGVNLWLLTTNLVEENKRAFMSEARRLLRTLFELFPFVVFLVSKEHLKARALAKHLGFSEVAFANQDFILAVKEKPVGCAT